MPIITLAIFMTSLAFSKDAANPKVPTSIFKQLGQYIDEQIDSDEADNCVWESEEEMKCRESEYKKARQFRYGDINGDGRMDLAVLYVLEGRCCGNNSRSYLAVFLNTISGYKLAISREIGRRGVRTLSLSNIKKQVINLTTHEYSSHDPMCCPSIKAKTFYIFSENELIEQNPTGEKYNAHE